MVSRQSVQNIASSKQTTLSFNVFSLLFIGRNKPRDLQITAFNNGLLMRNTVQLCFAANNILFMRKLLKSRSCMKMGDPFPELSENDFPKIITKNKLSDGMIKQLLNLVVAIFQCLADQLIASAIIYLLATDKSQYFAQLRPIIVNYYF